MNTDIKSGTEAPYFGALAAGGILLVALISYVFADYFLVLLLRHLQETDGILSLLEKNDDEISAMRAALLGVLNPAVTLAVTLSMLGTYFPNVSIRGLTNRFGMVGLPSIKLLVFSFVVGMVYVFFFSKVLMQFFPPDQFVTPHPGNVINYGSLWEKLLFAFTAITIVPLTEEFLFRGVLYQGVAHSWGKLISAICVSFIFVMMHPDTIKSGYWLTHLALYIFPFLMVLLREKTGTLFGSIMAHSGFNFAEIFF